ncbi:hypothetical protein BMBphi_gp024 [Bacillus phage vB_BthS_BMBphi]|nr:hypothetical protein BMBphi_gp024 [Bacillus phage vB_BthS_BMBphi]
MKIIKGERKELSREESIDTDGIITETVEYVQLPDKKILERSDRFIVTKGDGMLIRKNHVFMVTTVGENNHNIISVEHGTVYYGESATSIEELSQWIIEDFEDFRVAPLKVHLLPNQTF